MTLNCVVNTNIIDIKVPKVRILIRFSKTKCQNIELTSLILDVIMFTLI